MSFIAAMLLLNMDTVDAFICFSNLMHKPCQMAFFMVNQPLVCNELGLVAYLHVYSLVKLCSV